MIQNHKYGVSGTQIPLSAQSSTARFGEHTILVF